jgi:lipopolysaccharide biosynthesis regulator YciM
MGVSAAESWRQLLAAIGHSRLIDKHANTLTDQEISKANAIGMFFTGLKPQEIADAFAKFRIQANVEKAQKSAKQNFREYIRLGYLAANNGDPEQQVAWWKRAIKELDDADVPDHEIIQELSIALQNTPTTTQSAWQFAFGRHKPASKQLPAQEQYRSLMEMRENK